jgi:tetratricopeptide (TPR) repeat protein
MAARLPTACLVLAALCGAGSWTASAAAKPPDLPIKEQIYCAPVTPGDAASQTTTEADTHARAAEATALRTVSRCLLFGAHPLLALLPVDEWLVDDEEDAPAVGLPPADVTCPYLREKISREQEAPLPASAMPGTVLENLNKLEQAAQLYRQAGSCRRAGRTDEARDCYESIHELCPGSRYDRLAGEKLQTIEAGQSPPATEAAGEEEEVPGPCHGKPGYGLKKGATHDDRQSALDVEGQVTVLLERCQDAFNAGQYAEADTLARRALALSPEKVAGHPLVYKLHLLTLLRGGPPKIVRPFGGGEDEEAAANLLRQYADFFKRGLYPEAELCALQALAFDPRNPLALAAVRLATMQRVEQPRLSEPAPCPWANEPRTVMRPPELPSIDPTVSGAMDKILTTVGEPGTPGIAVTVVERGAGEEAEPADRGVTTVLLDPPADDPADCAAQNLPLQDLVDMLRSMACAETDGFPLPTRGRCHMTLGSVCADLSWEQHGEHGSFTLGVGFAVPDPDLREEQWEFNEHVSRWIERHSSGQASDDDDPEQP